MTKERANEIVDRIEAILLQPETVRRVAAQFTPLSTTRAASRSELAHALYIVTAQMFKAVSESPGQAAEFETFVRGADGSLSHVLFLVPCMPDPELCLIATLQDGTEEYYTERKRLSELSRNDGTMQLETVASFASYLKTLNPDAVDYWAKVYQRIGIDYPVSSDSSPWPQQGDDAKARLGCSVANNFSPLTSAKKTWWRFW